MYTTIHGFWIYIRDNNLTSIYIIEEKETWLLGPLRPRVGVHGLGIGNRVFVVKVLQKL